MKILFRLLLVAALLAPGFWLWTFLFPGPENIIRRQLAGLARTATFVEKENPIARVLKAQKVVNFFSPDAQLIFDLPGVGRRTLTGRDELTESATAGFATMRSLAVEFLDVTIQLAPSKQSADVELTAKVRSGDSKDFGVQEMRFVLKKIDGHWLIVRLETVKTLS